MLVAISILYVYKFVWVPAVSPIQIVHAAAEPTPTPVNLVENPGFESGNTGWDLWDGVSVFSQLHRQTISGDLKHSLHRRVQ
ncbi:hypothetical protein Back11_01580 [Paenibacillus baekrokdamisoli]|uniref:Uncharacterized protein n=1 Tax=Paenibacillus baekrokdamisoli TaxID=1712516 RepID=A0A3G9J297_9BACL|nr:hypothetical protein [Paenibacillus baekrokdamisoli]MBB3069213.1 hypothetical protein [Paenibacillus baekrokdamisoli]BBH18813.1 hypothetical protein Back11_01580 [Paenibacillus baekrokdamisoli]